MGRALAAGDLHGFAADVFAFEDWVVPGRPQGIHPALLAAPNTLFTSHIGSGVAAVREAMELEAARRLVEALRATPRAH